MRSCWLALLACSFLGLAAAQNPQPRAPDSWKNVENLPGIDFTGLTASQKEKVLAIMREQGCTCGCTMKLAECRQKDLGCSYSKALAAIVMKGVQEGKPEAAIAKLETASRWGHPPPPPKVLEAPVKIPVAGSPSQGPANARIILVEFSDFECPYCSKASGEVKAVVEAYPHDLRLIYKQFPLDTHPHARLAAAAALAARNQGKFWEMHDKLFANFHSLTRENILAWAADFGLDVPKFTADLVSPAIKTEIDHDIRDGLNAGVMGTPSFYIDGKQYNGPFVLASLKPIFEAELKGTQKVASK